MSTPPPFNPEEFANIAATERDHWWFRGQREILQRLLQPKADAGRGLILEGGCGTGYNSLWLQREFGWRMVPVDLSGVGLAHARRYGLDRLCQADITALPFPGACFDGVLSLDVIVHLPKGEEARAFQELARVVRPGGWLAIRVSALDILRSRHTEYAGERQRFERGRLMAGVRAAGLRVDWCSYANSLLMPVALAKFRIWEPLTGAKPSSGTLPVPSWMNGLFYQVLRLEAAALGAKFNFPAGQSLILLATREP
jgi:SAM-dependent methyltransferase